MCHVLKNRFLYSALWYLGWNLANFVSQIPLSASFLLNSFSGWINRRQKEGREEFPFLFFSPYLLTPAARERGSGFQLLPELMFLRGTRDSQDKWIGRWIDGCSVVHDLTRLYLPGFLWLTSQICSSVVESFPTAWSTRSTGVISVKFCVPTPYPFFCVCRYSSY